VSYYSPIIGFLSQAGLVVGNRYCRRSHVTKPECSILGGYAVCYDPPAVLIHIKSLFLPSSWILFLGFFVTLINLGVLYWKRHSHPTNLLLLSSFTVLEASTIGVAIAFYDTTIVLQALCVYTHPPSLSVTNLPTPV